MVFHSLAYRVVELAALCSFLCFFSSRAAPLEKTLASVFGLQARHVGLTESTTIRPPTPKYSPYWPYRKSIPLPSQHFALSSCTFMYCHLHSKKIEALITNQAPLKIPQSKDAVARSIPHCASQVNPGYHGSQIFILKYNHLPTLQCIFYRSYIAVVLKPFSSATNCDCRAELPLESCSIPSSEKLFLRPRSSWYVSLVERFQ